MLHRRAQPHSSRSLPVFSRSLQVALLARLQAAFEETKPLIPYASYCIDFGVLPDRVLVIELNPFGDHTGACNFSWKKGCG